MFLDCDFTIPHHVLVENAWFACYWVFGIHFPPILAKTCQLIENFIVGHKTKVPAHVNTCASKLKLK